jgi:hypothetical protein
MFCQTNKKLDIAEVVNIGITQNLKNLNGIDTVRSICRQYFVVVKNPKGILYWNAETRRIKHYSFDEFKINFFGDSQYAIKWKLDGEIPIMKNEKLIFDIIIGEDHYYQNFNINAPLFYERGDIYFVNLYDYSSPTYLEYDNDDKQNISIIFKLLLSACQNNFYHFSQVCELLRSAIMGKRHDKIIHFYGNKKIMILLDFFARYVLDRKNTSIVQFLNEYEKDDTSIFHGKTLNVINDPEDYSFDYFMQTKSKMKTIINQNLLSHKVNNVLNIILFTKKNVFAFEHNDNDENFLSIEVKDFTKDRYLEPNLGKKINFFMKNHFNPNNFFYKKYLAKDDIRLEHENGIAYDNVYNKFLLHIQKEKLFMDDKISVINFYNAFKKFCPKINNLNIKEFNTVYDKLIAKKNYHNKKNFKIKSDNIQDFYWTKQLDVYLSYTDFCHDLRVYSHIIYDKSIQKKLLADKITDIFGDTSILKPSSRQYTINIPFNKMNRIFNRNEWLTPLNFIIE